MRTPLYEQHVRLGGRMVDFAGWDLPIQYGSGQIAEHHAVRKAAGIFDVSHMGEVYFRGRDAVPSLNRLITNDLITLSTGKACYTAICRDDGGILDDAICYRLADDEVLVVVNASNVGKMVAWFRERASGDVQIDDESASTALLALQGPAAPEILERLIPGSRSMAPMSARRAAGAVVAASGYTGERGFELAVPWASALEWFERILLAGAGDGLIPVGLAARDTLRLEMKYALYGSDLDEQTNPLEAGLGWVTKLNKSDGFIGKDALRAIQAAGVRRRLVGLRVDGRGIARHGYPVLDDGEVIGLITSGTQSPTLGEAIAMAWVPPEKATVGTTVSVDVRGRPVPATVVKTPFLQRQV